MKKLLMIATLVTGATTVMAVPPTLQPPVTIGGTNSSSTEVRITANVVQGVAVNEASPIDFGNLARGMYDGTVSENTPGKIIVKGAPNDSTIKINLDKKQTDLFWIGLNGSPDNGTRDRIKTVNVTGLDIAPEAIELNGNGEYTRLLRANFIASKAAGDNNLGVDQKLGAYEGRVTVTATKQ